MGVRERVVPGDGPERGNVMLAAAMMLAVLVVLVALGLTLAPTGSDGITDESADDSEFDVVGSGLQQAVFVESNDTLDPDYDPEFRPPDSNGPAPIDNATIAELLAPEPFTDEQVVQIQSLLTSLGYRSVGGDIAALEPVPNETETGALVRLGNLEPRDLGDTDEPFVENATAVQDLELVFERTTLPTTPENATTAHVGNWTLAAYQNNSTDRVAYQLGRYDPSAKWQATESKQNLHVSVHEETVNGAPVAGGLEFDPGEPPVDVRVVDTNRSDGGVASTHGGLTLVAAGAGAADVNTDALSAETDWQEVVTRPVFNTTYLDATTTLDTRLTVDAEYTAFEYAHNGTEPFLMDVSLAVESEDPASLDGQLPAGAIWLPDYSLEPVNYTIDVIGTYSNGTEVDLSGPANVSIRNRTAGGPEPCANGQDCVAMYDDSEGTLPYNYLAIPHTLTDVQIQAEVAGIGAFTDTLRRNLSIVDPYEDTSLTLSTGSVAVGNNLGTLAMKLHPRKQGRDARTIPGPNISQLDSAPARHAANGLIHGVGAQGAHEVDQLAEALLQIRGLDTGERRTFRNANPSKRADLLNPDGPGLDSVTRLMRFFDANTTCRSLCENYTTEQAVEGPHELDTPPSWEDPDHGPQSRLALLYRTSDYDLASAQQLTTVQQVHQRDGPGIPEHKLYELVTDNYSLTDPALVTTLTRAIGWDNTSARNRTSHIALKYIEAFAEKDPYGHYIPSGSLYEGATSNSHNFGIVADRVGDLAKSNGESVPNAFGDLATDLFQHLANTNGQPEDYSGHRPSQQLVYFWLGGVADSQTRQDLRDTVRFGGESQPGVARSTELLFEMADYTLLDQQALDQGGVELATLDELRAIWNVTMDATYTGYSFANYSATDPVAVEDPASNVVDINVSVAAADVGPLLARIDVPSLYSDEVLRVNHSTDITTTVTFRGGREEVNPPYVRYDLLGPEFDSGPCIGAERPTGNCYPSGGYDGPTTPGGFATVSDPQHTILPQRQTGLTQVGRSGLGSITNQTGPLVLAASVAGNTVNDTVTTSVVDLQVTGELTPETEWTDPAEYYINPSDAPDGVSPQKKPVGLGATYDLEHIAGDVPYHYGKAPFTGTESTALPESAVIETEATRDGGGYPTKRTVTLTATDSAGNSITVSRPVILAPEGARYAAFAPDTAHPTTGEQVTFNASGSNLPKLVEQHDRYTWRFGDGTTRNTSDPEVTHSYDTPGTYTVDLTIRSTSDALSVVYSTFRTVVVTQTESDLSVALATNPGAVIQAHQSWDTYAQIGPRLQTGTFDARDSRGDIVDYTWEFGDGTSVTTDKPTVNHTYSPGSKPVSYTSSVQEFGGDDGITLETDDYSGKGGVRIWLSEENALNLTNVPKDLPGVYYYNVDDGKGGGCTQCGDPSDPPVGPFSVLGSKNPNGGLSGSIALTTFMNEQTEVNETVDPTVRRGNYRDILDNPPGFLFTIRATEGQPSTYYLWSNAGALDKTRGDSQSLSDGSVSWRDSAGCVALKQTGCLDEPSGIVDHLAVGGVQWNSNVQSWSTEIGSAPSDITLDSDPIYGETGRHTHELTFDVSATNTPDPITGQLNFGGKHPEFGSEFTTVDVKIMPKDNGGGGPDP